MGRMTSGSKSKNQIELDDQSLFGTISTDQVRSLDSDEKIDNSMSEIITLRVGGRIFRTSKATLLKSLYFKALLGNKFGDQARDGSYFIDRDGDFFKYIMRFLRNGRVTVSAEDIEDIAVEAQYYQIPMDFTEALRRVR